MATKLPRTGIEGLIFVQDENNVLDLLGRFVSQGDYAGIHGLDVGQNYFPGHHTGQV